MVMVAPAGMVDPKSSTTLPASQLETVYCGVEPAPCIETVSSSPIFEQSKLCVPVFELAESTSTNCGFVRSRLAVTVVFHVSLVWPSA